MGILSGLISENVDRHTQDIVTLTATASISGFSEKFIFFGFLSEKLSVLKKELQMLSKIDCSIIFFSSPRKFLKNLEKFQEYFSDRELVICREITKLHEEFIRLKVSDLKKIDLNIKGELTAIFSEKKNSTNNFNYLKIDDFDDLIPYLIIGIIIGGRVGYVVLYNVEYYFNNLREIF